MNPDAARTVERFAAVLVEAGIPRMPARAFATLIAADAGRLTAAELAERLQASPAAISGAVRYLTQVRLVHREREPGTRRDVFAIGNDLWYEAILQREPLLTRWGDAARELADALGPGTPAGDRLAETAEFFEFMRSELPTLLERWRAGRSG